MRISEFLKYLKKCPKDTKVAVFDRGRRLVEITDKMLNYMDGENAFYIDLGHAELPEEAKEIDGVDCPACEKEIQLDITNAPDGQEVEIKCPHCKAPLTGEVVKYIILSSEEEG